LGGFLFTSASWGNFGYGLADAPIADQLVAENRNRLPGQLSLNSVVFMNQTHSNQVVQVNGAEELAPGDAIVTTERNLGLAVQVGDCLPILIKGEAVVAAIHAGRKGLTNGLIANTLTLIGELAQAGPVGERNTRELTAIIGPSICRLCYEVSPQMYSEVISNYPSGATSDLAHSLDLAAMAATQLREFGLKVSHFELCTNAQVTNAHGRNSDYFSHRRNPVGASAGRSLGVIWL
jgi:YfiH family protein